MTAVKQERSSGEPDENTYDQARRLKLEGLEKRLAFRKATEEPLNSKPREKSVGEYWKEVLARDPSNIRPLPEHISGEVNSARETWPGRRIRRTRRVR